MERINNQRLDRFCEYVFSGMAHTVAFTEAGYSSKSSPPTIARASKRLMKRPYVVTRLAELRQKAENALIMDVTERKQRLTQIGRANITDFVDKDGKVTIKPNGAISEVVIDVLTDKKVKLRDPIAAIAELNRMDGIGGKGDNAPVSVTVNTQVNQISSIHQELDGDTLVSVTRILGEVGALRLGAAENLVHPADEVYSAQADAKAISVPVSQQS
jgi:hypothetical protein